MPRVSVIMPAYNAAAFVGTAIQSVLDQSVRDAEIVVVDDGSTDRTPDVVDAMAARDPRIRFTRGAHSGRPAVVRNAALAQASGEFIAFLDSDDAYHPRKLERQLAAFDALPVAGAVFHDYSRFETEPVPAARGDLSAAHYVERIGGRFASAGDDLYLGSERFPATMALIAVAMITCSSMFRRSALGDELRFSEELTVAEDIDLYFRAAHRAPVAYIDQVLCYRRRRPGSLSLATAPVRAAADMLRAHELNFTRLESRLLADERRRYRRLLAEHWFSLGYAEVRGGHAERGRAAYRQSLRLTPRVQTIAAYLKSFASRSRPHPA